jgi:hypothetical protein
VRQLQAVGAVEPFPDVVEAGGAGHVPLAYGDERDAEMHA